MSPEPNAEAAVIMRTLTALVEPLAAVMPGECEVVLHDLRLMPNSIVAIAGNLTERKIGDPATDLLLRAAAKNDYASTLNYASRHRDGRVLRSTTLICRLSDGTPLAALCFNNDTQAWRLIADLARGMLPEVEVSEAGPEEFPQDVDDLSRQMLAQAIGDAGVAVALMKKQHKIAVVRDLRSRGFFLLHKGVETAAQALGVTRFTIYHYLNEIELEEAGS